MTCSGSAGTAVTYTPSLRLGGHFRAKVDTRNLLGVGIPSEASLDVEITVTATGAMAVVSGGKAECHLQIPPVVRTITVSPVPISAVLKPEGRISVDGHAGMEDVGVTATAGVPSRARWA